MMGNLDYYSFGSFLCEKESEGTELLQNDLHYKKRFPVQWLVLVVLHFAHDVCPFHLERNSLPHCVSRCPREEQWRKALC